jgi:hypothetical protein
LISRVRILRIQSKATHNINVGPGVGDGEILAVVRETDSVDAVSVSQSGQKINKGKGYTLAGSDGTDAYPLGKVEYIHDRVVTAGGEVPGQ